MILVVSDLHLNQHYFQFISDRIVKYDYLFISGDIINGFYLDPQRYYDEVSIAKSWLQSLKDKNPRLNIYYCTGNHDLPFYKTNQHSFYVDRRMSHKLVSTGYDLPKEYQYHIDTKFGKILKTKQESVFNLDFVHEDFSIGEIDNSDYVVFCLPYYSNVSKVDKRALKVFLGISKTSKYKNKKHIWLHHKPVDGPVSESYKQRSGGLFSSTLKKLILHNGFKPSYVFSGHVHEAPYVNNGSHVMKLDDTYIFNAGTYSNQKPNFIELDNDLIKTYLCYKGNDYIVKEQKIYN